MLKSLIHTVLGHQFKAYEGTYEVPQIFAKPQMMTCLTFICNCGKVREYRLIGDRTASDEIAELRRIHGI